MYLGAGASGADVMLIMSGSLIGIMPKVMFLLLVSYVHLTCTEEKNFEVNSDKLLSIAYFSRSDIHPFVHLD